MERLTFLNGDGIPCVRDDQCCEERIDENYRESKLNHLADQEYLRMLKAALDQLTAYKQAEKEGRLVMRPCKVGDTIWYRTYTNNGKTYLGIRPHKVLAHKEYIIVEGYPINTELQLDWLGKVWYLSQEEAERALEGMRNGNQ